MYFSFIEWFEQQTEFTTEFESMDIDEMNKCLSKFYVSARKKDGSYYKKTARRLSTTSFQFVMLTRFPRQIKH